MAVYDTVCTSCHGTCWLVCHNYGVYLLACVSAWCVMHGVYLLA